FESCTSGARIDPEEPMAESGQPRAGGVELRTVPVFPAVADDDEDATADQVLHPPAEEFGQRIAEARPGSRVEDITQRRGHTAASSSVPGRCSCASVDSGQTGPRREAAGTEHCGAAGEEAQRGLPPYGHRGGHIRDEGDGTPAMEA